MFCLKKVNGKLVSVAVGATSLAGVASAAAPAWIATSIADFSTAMTDALGAAAGPALGVLALFITFHLIVRLMRRVSK